MPVCADLEKECRQLMCLLDHKAHDKLVRDEFDSEMYAMEDDRDALQIALRRKDSETMEAMLAKYRVNM